MSLFLGSILLIGAIITTPGIGGLSEVSAQTTNTTTMPVIATTPSPANVTTSSSTNLELYKRMAELEYSNKPQEIATLAYIWGFPLVATERQFNFVTNPNVPPGPTRGPANSISCARDVANSTFTDNLRPNVDTLYCIAYFDLNKEPVVIVVPAINDNRYYSFAFFDAYSNSFDYVGTRATGSTTTGGGST